MKKLFLLFFVFLYSCSLFQVKETANITLSLPSRSLDVLGNIKSYKLSVSGDDFSTIERIFTDTKVSVEIPAGNNRLFMVEALGADGEVIFSGKVTANIEQGTEIDLKITLSYIIKEVISLSSTKEITSFSFNDLAVGEINESEGAISLTVPFGTSLTSLTPTIVHTGVSISPLATVAQDFGSPVKYTVTAEDGSTKAYTVTVTEAAQVINDIQGLIAHYKFEDTANDELNMHNGTPVGGITYIEGRTPSTKAASFNGSSYIKLYDGNGIYFDTTAPWTVAAWVKSEDTTSPSSAIVSRYSGNQSIKLRQYLGNGNIGLTNGQDHSFTYTAINQGWVHLTFVSNGSSVTMYVNNEVIGVDVTVSSKALKIPFDTIGACRSSISSYSDGLKGAIDELWFFNTELDAAGVNDLYNQ